MRKSLLLVTAFLISFAGTPSKSADLTLCWAAWDPANALVELSNTKATN